MDTHEDWLAALEDLGHDSDEADGDCEEVDTRELQDLLVPPLKVVTKPTHLTSY